MSKELNPRIIGLTGNMACGKSTVAQILAGLGVPVIDADQVSREVSLPGTRGFNLIVSTFGPGVLNTTGQIDRAKLRDIVFNDAEKRRQLERILHPQIQKRTQELFAQFFSQGKTTVVYEASLLFEAGREKNFDGMLVVTCPEDEQIKRVTTRDPSITRELAMQMIKAQMPQAEKAKRATWVLENNGTVEELTEKTKVWAKSL